MNSETTKPSTPVHAHCSTENGLPWTSDEQWIQSCVDAMKRGKIRRCAACDECGKRFEAEFERTKEVQRKQIQCNCGHVQVLTYFP